MNRNQLILITTGIFIVAFAAGWGIRGGTEAVAVMKPPREIRIDEATDRFTNPILFYEASSSTDPEFVELRDKISDFVDQKIKEKSAESISVYMRDLNSGRWTGNNINEKYEPSSMLKVSVMMAYLRHAIENPEILDSNLYYEGSKSTGQYYVSDIKLKAGYQSVQELIKLMIVSSDNVAADTLIAHDPEYTSKIFTQFRLPEPPKDHTDFSKADFMSVRSFAPIFRVLYNSTYLPQNLSEQALGLLTQTDFKKGLNAGVPDRIVVAHKFGERTNQLTNGTVINRELHDCGIIYYPGKPYLLCIMTRGQQFPDLEKVISSLSKLVYDYVQQTGI